MVANFQEDFDSEAEEFKLQSDPNPPSLPDAQQKKQPEIPVKFAVSSQASAFPEVNESESPVANESESEAEKIVSRLTSPTVSPTPVITAEDLDDMFGLKSVKTAPAALINTASSGNKKSEKSKEKHSVTPPVPKSASGYNKSFTVEAGQKSKTKKVIITLSPSV